MTKMKTGYHTRIVSIPVHGQGEIYAEELGRLFSELGQELFDWNNKCNKRPVDVRLTDGFLMIDYEEKVE